MHHIWLCSLSASGLHQGAHVDITWTTTSGGWALVLPAFGAHRASLGGMALCLRIPCRGGLPRPPAITDFMFCVGCSYTRFQNRYPRATGPVSNFVLPSDNRRSGLSLQILRVGANRRVRPHPRFFGADIGTVDRGTDPQFS